MDDRYRSQLQEFRKEDEARWQYEADEVQRQVGILNEDAVTDSDVKADLERAGLNVGALEEESDRSVRRLERVHDDLMKVEPPPRSRGRKDRIKMERVAALAGSHTWLFPPAYEAWGNSEDCGFNVGLAETNQKRDSKGSGWGWGAAAYATRYCTLWFYYFPPRAGELLVKPHVDFQGNVSVSAHDHYYTNTHAALRLKLHFDLFQHYWDGEQTATIVNEHRHSSSTSYWVDDHRIMSKSLSVSADDIVWIKLTTSLYVEAHSSHAQVGMDFRTGGRRRIRAEHIWVDLS